MKHLQKTKTHDLYQVALHDRDMLPVIAYGDAGGGKTYGAIGAAVKWLSKSPTHKFVGLRPNVDVGEAQGFLPGDEREKLAPWIEPLEQNFEKHGVCKSHLENLERSGRVRFRHLGYQQGLTHDNTFIFLDEAGNASFQQMIMMLTRQGENSKLVIAGDVEQVSDKFKYSGFAELLEFVEFTNFDAHTIGFTLDDCMRSERCKKALEAYYKWKAHKATRGVRAA